MNKILLIDDDPALIGLYQKAFELAKFVVYHAFNGEEGLKIALEQHPDIIILDITMPKMNGKETLQALRLDEWGKEVPVIMLSSLATDKETLAEIIDSHPLYYLLKDVSNPDDVLEKVKGVLNKTDE
jgi:two-component system alkaline phosphatase synthesis response regulator PhoP